MRESEPPKIAAAVLSVLGHPRDREYIAGDLDEGYARRVARSRWKARWWYWQQVLRSISLRGRRGGGRYGQAPRSPSHPGSPTCPGGGRGDRFPALFGRDVMHALRGLRKEPGLASTVVLTLALGIGAGTAVFSMVEAVLLRDLPYENPQELVFLRTDFAALQGFAGGMDVHTLADLRDRSTVTEWGALSPVFLNDIEVGGARAPVQSSFVTGNLLHLLGIEPVRGRHATDSELAEMEAGAPAGIYISHALWTDHFGAREEVTGLSVRISGGDRVLLGVLPPGFRVWLGQQGGTNVPPSLDVLEISPHSAFAQASRGNGSFRTVGRLADGATVEAAQSELTAIRDQLLEEYPGAYEDRVFTVARLRDDLVQESRRTLFLQVAAVVLVLLVSTLNGASLLVARANRRERELALRAALGGGRGALLRQLFAEGLVFAMIAGGAGLLMAGGLIRVLGTVAPSSIPRGDTLGLDPTVLGLSILVTVGTAIIAMVGPAWYSTRVEPARVLRAGGGRGTLRSTSARSGLVVGQVAFSFPVIVASLLLGQTLINLQRADLGFDPESVVAFQLTGLDRFADPASGGMYALWQEMEAGLGAIPGVTAVGGAVAPPLMGLATARLTYSRDAVSDPEERQVVDLTSVHADFLGAMGLPLLEGRRFEALDTLSDRLIVDRSLVEELWPGEPGVGKTVYLDGSPWEIIGVVPSVRRETVRGVSRPQGYGPLPILVRRVLVRADRDTDALIPDLQRALTAIDPALRMHAPEAYSAIVAAANAETRFASFLLFGLAGVTLALTGFGLFGLIAFLGRQRLRESGIRMALGASRRHLHWVHLRPGLRLAAMGVPVGIGIALIASRWLESQLYGVGALSPPVFLAAAVCMVLAIMAASASPAHQATRVDPSEALRAE